MAESGCELVIGRWSGWRRVLSGIPQGIGVGSGSIFWCLLMIWRRG